MRILARFELHTDLMTGTDVAEVAAACKALHLDVDLSLRGDDPKAAVRQSELDWHGVSIAKMVMLSAAAENISVDSAPLGVKNLIESWDVQTDESPRIKGLPGAL